MHGFGFVALAIVALASAASGQESAPAELRLEVGQTKKVSMSKRQVIAEVRNEMPKICRVQAIDADAAGVLITGVGPGRARVTFMDANKRVETIDVIVGNDVVVAMPAGHAEFSLLDGSIVRLVPQTRSFDIDTGTGRLLVAIQEVRGIDFGLRFPGDAKKQVAQAVNKLGSGNFQEREQASRALIALGPWSYAAALEASKADDPETSRRGQAVVDELQERHPLQDMTRPEQDRVVTNTGTITGRILLSTFKAKSDALGEVDLPLARLRSLRTSREFVRLKGG
jgi:hypothetical protein